MFSLLFSPDKMISFVILSNSPPTYEDTSQNKTKLSPYLRRLTVLSTAGSMLGKVEAARGGASASGV